MSSFVGRERELGQVEAALATLVERRAAVVDLVGEPGIGKSTLLDRIAEGAAERQALVLSGRASEFEQEAPFGVFVDAIDRHVRSLDPGRLVRLGPEHLAELATVFPSLEAFADDAILTPKRERYRLHRAVRSLLERLAVGGGLALVLDDMQWADPASAELAASLVRQPVDAAVLLAVAYRTGRLGPPLDLVLDQAAVSGASTRIALGPLSLEEAAPLLPADLAAAPRQALYEQSGGNPFYLEQLGRHPLAVRGPGAPSPSETVVGEVPEAVAISLAQELSPLSPQARLLLQGAGVTGDPFEIGLAAAAAGLSEGDALVTLDELLAADLIRDTPTPRSFRFRHPLLRHAVYESAQTGWRLAAHARAAAALEAVGAGARARAHHVEQAAAVGDLAAIALLAQAAEDAAPRAPAAAARWLQSAVRLVPQDGPASAARQELLPQLGLALVAAGRFEEAQQIVLEALDRTPPGDPARPFIIAGCARIDRVLGRSDPSRARLVEALADRDPADLSATVTLGLEMINDGAPVGDFALMIENAEAVIAAAEELGDPGPQAAASGAMSFANYSLGRYEESDARALQTHRLLAGLSDEQLAVRLETVIYPGWTECFMARFELARTHFAQGLRAARATGRAMLVIELMAGEAMALSCAGRIAEALDVADATLEEARMMGNGHTLVWALLAQCMAVEPAVDPSTAQRVAEEAVEAARRYDGTRFSAVCGWVAGAVFVAAGQGERAVAVTLELLGGEDLEGFFPGHRAACYEMLTRAELQAGRLPEAEAWSSRARASATECGLPFAGAMADRAQAEVLLAAGDPQGAAALALSAAEATEGLGAAVESARSRVLAGRALAAAGDRDGAAQELRGAEVTLMECGAERLRVDAVRELRKIGRRVSRQGRGGRADAQGVAALSVREREVADLAAAGATNRAIAGELFLSEKTVESHMASIFVKVGVDARSALAGALAA